MVQNKRYTRVDTLELKAKIIRKIGHQRADKYFDQLKRFFAFNISKSEFNGMCIQIIGREGLPLHNQFIRSILKNAFLAQSPPCGIVRTNLSTKPVRGHEKNLIHPLHGFVLPPSPRKIRSPGNRGCKFRDRPSPLGPLGKPQVIASEELAHKAREQSPTELSLGSKPPVEIASVEDGEEVEQLAASPGVQSRSPVTAPLGISVNFTGARKSISNISIHGKYDAETCQNKGELPDTSSLKSIMEHTLEAEGIKVSVNCANLLNNALDAYLKRLIVPSMSLAGSKFGSQHSRPCNSRGANCISGMGPWTGRSVQRSANPVCASMLDLQAAMEVKPELLGEDWPVQLEKICSRAFSG